MSNAFSEKAAGVFRDDLPETLGINFFGLAFAYFCVQPFAGKPVFFPALQRGHTDAKQGGCFRLCCMSFVRWNRTRSLKWFYYNKPTWRRVGLSFGKG